MRITLLLVLPLLTTPSCSAPDPSHGYDAYFNNAPPVLLDGLGPSGHTIDSTALDAQAWFDQGIALCWNYNQAEAVRAFQQIVNTDPHCAIAYWGLAYALGPNPFYPDLSDDQARRAHRAAQKALEHVDQATAVERALIEAMAVRYEWPQPDDRTSLNLDYADAMRDVSQRFPGNAMVGTLCADAILTYDGDWGNWGADADRGFAAEVITILEAVLDTAPEYSGANHFYIHAVESSDRPERGLASANRLQTLMPGAGHLVHMSGHIYMRLGMYDETITANQRAIEADDAYFRRVPKSISPYYDLRAHNHHFMIWAAMFRGSYALSMSAARKLIRGLPKDPDYPWVGWYRFVPIHVMMRFGRWEDILAEPSPIVDQTSVALWRHARAIAHANLGQFGAARQEADAFEEAAARIPEDAALSAPREDLLGIARGMMWGEILYKDGDADGAFAALRRAIELEDELEYNEPAAWMQPVRHAYGALLLDAGRLDDAERAYREDLERFADNVWSLHGLAECLRRQGRDDEALAVEERFRAASKHADVPITASCFCGAD